MGKISKKDTLNKKAKKYHTAAAEKRTTAPPYICYCYVCYTLSILVFYILFFLHICSPNYPLLIFARPYFARYLLTPPPQLSQSITAPHQRQFIPIDRAVIYLSFFASAFFLPVLIRSMSIRQISIPTISNRAVVYFPFYK